MFISYKETPVIAIGKGLNLDRGFILRCTKEQPILLKGNEWEHDLSQEDFTQYDYVELNGVRFNRARTK